MALTTLLANLALLLILLGTLVLLKYTGGLDLLIHGFDWIKTAFGWLMRNRMFSTMFFIFLIGIAGFIVGFILDLNYACDSQNRLRIQNLGMIGGVGMVFAGIGNELNATDPSYDDFIANWTSIPEEFSDTSERGLMGVDCVNQEPKLTVFGVDFLNFQYWILVMLIVAVLKVIQFRRSK
jgi:hypothetical protein